MTMGVYEIKNKKNDKKYVGSTKNLNRRFKEHKSDLVAKEHTNPYLQNAWNKHGKNSFDFVVLEEFEKIDRDRLYLLEQEYIDSGNYDYNITLNAAGGMNRAGHRGGAVITGEDAVKIRERYHSGGITQDELADEYGISQVTISAILYGRLWPDFPGPRSTPRKRTSINDVLEIRREYAEGKITHRELSERYDRDMRTICRILRHEVFEKIGGPKVSGFKLTPKRVREIRRRYKNGGVSRSVLAKDYGVSASCIYATIVGKRWADSGGPIKGVDYD